MTDADQPREKDPRGRKPHERSEATAEKVRELAGHGLPVEQIASVVRMSRPTLYKYYEDDVAYGQAVANAKVAESLFNKATGEGQGAVTAAIFWCKTRMGWRETSTHEHVGREGGPIQIADLSNLSDEQLATLATIFGPLATAGGDDDGDPGGTGEAEG